MDQKHFIINGNMNVQNIPYMAYSVLCGLEVKDAN